MYAFGLAETNSLEEAERLALQGTDMAPFKKDPWCHHAVAHCMELTGRLDEGIRFMESMAPTWNECGSFMYSHNWWHTSLFYLDRDASDIVLDIYDKHIWLKAKESAQEQIGATALLWRLDLRKIPVASHWDDVSDYIVPHIKEHIQPFLDLHYIYALAKSGKDERVKEMLDSLNSSALYQKNQSEVTRYMAEAFVLYARGDWESSYKQLAPIYDRTKEIGGSQAQRDVFEQTYIDILLQTRRYDRVKGLLEDRVSRRPNTPYLYRNLHTVYSHLGMTEEAQHADTKSKELERFYRQTLPTITKEIRGCTCHQRQPEQLQ